MKKTARKSGAPLFIQGFGWSDKGTAAHVRSAEKILNRAGITLLAENSHRYDMVNQIVGLNFLSTGDFVGAIGSLVYARHVLNGTIGQSPHTLYRGDAKWQACMENDEHGRGHTAMQRLFRRVEPTATSVPTNKSFHLRNIEFY